VVIAIGQDKRSGAGTTWKDRRSRGATLRKAVSDMPRYIDAEKLCKALGDMAFYQNPYKQSTILGVVESIEQFPTADVAPRAEVAREILKEARQAVLSLVLANAMGENFDLEKRFSEIEKKYTEETDAEGGDGTE
jgi:hypothetical protein